MTRRSRVINHITKLPRLQLRFPRIIGRLECGRTQLEISEELGIVQSVISRLWQRFQDDGNVHVTTKRNTIDGGAGGLVWGGIILGYRTDLHVQSATMTGHIYRDVILEQHVLFCFRGAMGAEFLFMDENARPHRANIVDECLQSEGYHPYGLISILNGT
ncbi:cubilin [Trichonephila clavipes]|nr:cubilin [Trichonephila clavipes]